MAISIASLLARRCARCARKTLAPLCRSCSEKDLVTKTTPSGLSIRALGSYLEPLGGHLRALKYEDSTYWGEQIGDALALQLGSHRLPDLVPVPLHPERLVERGYNQSALIARRIGKRTRSQVTFSVLSRQRNTRAQALLTADERSRNLKHAFTASPQPGMRAMLVDDVVTTGHTLDACAAALKLVGVPVIGALVAAVASDLPTK